MGVVFSAVWRSITSSGHECKIVLLGLSNAGKTTLLYRLNLGLVIVSQPTIGSNVEEVSHKNVKFQAWDVGGGEGMRSSWSSYFDEVEGIVYVVDSSDFGTLSQSKVQLSRTLSAPELRGIPILIYADKQDIRGARTAAQLSEDLSLVSIKNNSWHIQACSAKTGDGLTEGLDWLGMKVKEKQSFGSAVRAVFSVGS